VCLCVALLAAVFVALGTVACCVLHGACELSIYRLDWLACEYFYRLDCF
jgi:hypothetical protein